MLRNDGKLGEKKASNLPTGAVTTFVCTTCCYPCAWNHHVPGVSTGLQLQLAQGARSWCSPPWDQAHPSPGQVLPMAGRVWPLTMALFFPSGHHFSSPLWHMGWLGAHRAAPSPPTRQEDQPPPNLTLQPASRNHIPTSTLFTPLNHTGLALPVLPQLWRGTGAQDRPGPGQE